MINTIEQALEREAKRLRPPEPVVVRTVDDIKRMVIELDPQKNKSSAVTMNTTVEVTDQNRRATYQVTAPSRSRSKRDLLVDGLQIIRNRLEAKPSETAAIEINGVVMKPAMLGNAVDGLSWVDPLITQWLGAHRDGYFICWDIGDGFLYKYDIWQHRLTRAPKSNG